MTETELLANPPANAEKPHTVLRSTDGDNPQLCLISNLGSRWDAFGFEGIWSSWQLVGGFWETKGFHADDWEEITPRLEAESQVEWGCAQPGVIVPCPTKESAQLRAASKFGGVVLSRTVTPWKES